MKDDPATGTQEDPVGGKPEAATPPKTRAATRTTPASEKELRKYAKDLGWIGHIAGNKDLAPTNIAFVIVLLAFGTGLAALFLHGKIDEKVLDFWKVLLPIVTLILGYVFAKGSQK